MKFLDLMPSFGMNDFMFNRCMDLIEEKDAAFRFSDKTNSLRGIAAHLLIARHNLGNLTEMGFTPLPWNDLGEMFEAGFVEVDNFPTLAAIREEWRKITPMFMEKLPAVSDDILNREPPFPLPGFPEATLGDFVKLNVVHESYHLGQLSLLVKEVSGESIMVPPSKES